MIKFLKELFSRNQRIQNLIYNKNNIYKIIIFQRHMSQFLQHYFSEVTVQANSAVAVPTGANKDNGSHPDLL